MKDAIRYIVTVKATIERTEIIGKDWAVLDQTEKGSTYGYTPETLKTVKRDIQVFEQTVEALDLPALVAVINGLGE